MLLATEETFQIEEGANAKIWKMGLVCVRTSVHVIARQRVARDGIREVMGSQTQGPYSEMSSIGAFWVEA